MYRCFHLKVSAHGRVKVYIAYAHSAHNVGCVCSKLMSGAKVLEQNLEHTRARGKCFTNPARAHYCALSGTAPRAGLCYVKVQIEWGTSGRISTRIPRCQLVADLHWDSEKKTRLQ